MGKVSDVAASLKRFASNKDFPSTLIMTGAWGSGKTHLWKDVLQTVGVERLARENYAYCSLSGLTSIDEIKNKLIAETAPVRTLVDTEPTGKWSKLLKRIVPASLNRSTVKDGSLRLIDFAHVRAGAVARHLAWGTVSDCVVCLDDLERTSVPIKEILGLITLLRDERNCKVIVIMNEEMLAIDGKAEIAVNRDKVFDVRLFFNPALDYATRHGLPIDAALPDVWTNAFQLLQVQNIRVIRQIYDFLCQLNADLGAIPDEYHAHQIRSACLLGAIVLAPSDKIPPEQFIVATEEWVRQQDIGSPEYKEATTKWFGFIAAYGWTAFDLFSQEILTVLRDGTFSQNNVVAALEAYQAAQKLGFARKDLQNGWNLFWGSFSSNQDEVVEVLASSHFKYAAYLSANQLDPVVRLLRDLGENGRADGLIAEFVKTRRIYPKGIGDERNSYAYAAVDPAFCRALDAVFAKSSEPLLLEDVLIHSASNNGWTGDQSRILDSSKTPDYFAAFARVSSEQFHTALRGLLTLMTSGGSLFEAVRIEAKPFLQDICLHSAINRARLKQAGGEQLIQ